MSEDVVALQAEDYCKQPSILMMVSLEVVVTIERVLQCNALSRCRCRTGCKRMETRRAA